MKISLFLYIFILFFSFACNKKHQERKYTLLEISAMVREGDPEMKTVLGLGMDAGISCTTYGPGCLSARRMMVRRVDMGVIEFQTPEQARVVAKKIDQYFAGNWVFDDVVGEPVLEEFMAKHLKAHRPALEKEDD